MSWSYAFEGTKDAVKKEVADEVARMLKLDTMTDAERGDVRASQAIVSAHLDALKLGVSVAPKPPNSGDDAKDDPRQWNAVRAQASGTHTDGMANFHVHVERKYLSL